MLSGRSAGSEVWCRRQASAECVTRVSISRRAALGRPQSTPLHKLTLISIPSLIMSLPHALLRLSVNPPSLFQALRLSNNFLKSLILCLYSHSFPPDSMHYAFPSSIRYLLIIPPIFHLISTLFSLLQLLSQVLSLAFMSFLVENSLILLRSSSPTSSLLFHLLTFFLSPSPLLLPLV